MSARCPQNHLMAATPDCWIAILQRTPAMLLPLQSHKTCLSGVRSFVSNIGLLSVCVPSPIQSSGDAVPPNQLYKHFSCAFPRREDPEYESLVLTKDMAEIIYHRVEHTDEEGLLCHGLGSQNCPARYKWPPQMSQECRSFIVDALRRKVPMQHILQAVRDRALLPYLDGNTFADAVEALLEEKVERDFFIKGQDIRNIRKQVEQEHFILHSNDATSIKLWVEQNPESVLCYFGQKLSNHGTELEPFLLGICAQWQREILYIAQNTLGIHAVLKTILHKNRTAQKKKNQKNWRQQKTQRILIIQQDSNVTKWPLIISHSPSCAQPSCANCSSTIFTQFAGSCRYSTNMSLWLCSVYSFSSQQRTLPRQHPPQTPLHNNQAYY